MSIDIINYYRLGRSGDNLHRRYQLYLENSIQIDRFIDNAPQLKKYVNLNLI